MTLAVSSASAASPVPFFRNVDRVGVLCAISPAPGAEAPELRPEAVCRVAVEELSDLLSPAGATSTPPAPPVVTLTANDPRLADPGTLGVLLHVHVQSGHVQSGHRPSGDGESGGSSRTGASDTGCTLAASVSLYRNRPESGGPPLFPAPPEAVVLRDGVASAEILRLALRRLLTSAVSRPLAANR